jgi:hypothetical protein
MIAAVKITHLEKTMNWFGVYPTISKVQELTGHHIIMGRKHSKVFQTTT